MDRKIVLLGLFATLLQCASCLQFTTGPADGATVHACDGGDLALFWGVALNQGETLTDVKWFHQGAGDGGSREMVAILAGGTFLPTASYAGRVTQTQNAGIIVSQVSAADAGNYSVEIIAEDEQNALRSGKRFALVDFASEVPVVSGGSLSARQEPMAALDSSTGQYHVALTCGTLANRGQPPADVMWTTPSGGNLPSSFQDAASSTLLVPNPVVGGTYACFLPSNSGGAACLPPNSPALVPAEVIVDELQARLAVLEAQTQALSGLVDGNLQALNELSTRQVSFQVGLSGNWSARGVMLMDRVVSNHGNAYDPSTGYFTAPFNGSYFFSATASTFDAPTPVILKVMGDDASEFNIACRIISDRSDHNMGSCHAVLDMRAGQRAWANNGDGNYSPETTSFVGFYIGGDL